MIDAVHILLLMRFCTNCIGKHRVNKKIVGIIFAAFFIVSCYLRLMPVSKKFSAANTITSLDKGTQPFVVCDG